MRYYGPKRIKQYRIRWKGYAPAYDTWEPIENIHAPELVQQFLNEQGHGRDISIRMARVGATKDDMHDPRESQFEIPGLQPTTNIPSRTLSINSDPECTTRLATEFSARVLKETPSPKQKETGAAGAVRANPSPGPAKPKRIQSLTPPSKPSTLPSNSLNGTSSNTSTPQPLGTPQPSTPLAPGTTPPKAPSLDAAIAYALQSVLTKTTTYSTTASAKTSTAPYTTRKCPTTLSRWRPNLPLAPPIPSINDPFQNAPSPCLFRPSQHSSPSPWPMATKKPSKASPKASSPPSKNTPKKSARPTMPKMPASANWSKRWEASSPSLSRPTATWRTMTHAPQTSISPSKTATSNRPTGSNNWTTDKSPPSLKNTPSPTHRTSATSSPTYTALMTAMKTPSYPCSHGSTNYSPAPPTTSTRYTRRPRGGSTGRPWQRYNASVSWSTPSSTL